MARKKSNWTFADIVSFLKAHGFILHHTKGSHHFYRGHIGGQVRLTHIQYHGSKSIHPKTLGSVIKQSGIPEKDWLA